MKLLSYILILMLPLMCSSPKDENYDSEAYEDSEIVYEETSLLSSKVYSPETSTQKIIKTSYLKFETDDLDKTYLQIKKAIQDNKGFIKDDNSNKSYNTITRHIIVRIPTNNFQNTLDAVSKNVDYFDTKRISAKDVTEEFIDLEARLKAKLTLEKRYLELLSKAKNVKEMLEIERELSNIREEIEAKQGRLKYLQNKVSLSTLDIEFYKLTSEAPVTKSYSTKMWNAIKAGFNGISIFFLGLLHIWPFIIILFIGGYFIKKWIKKSKK
ncbi:DUF4349 domain-containing protein [Algibacter marinivivus]|uniref:DUF4349 domain-containing protein n=1 Tax=Algibacter marinivivus TaxID=2100723 RepID=A0A2U2X862_9FLAO|nr:DUF4349 domain-containing protein [Algibacter marinivivus]PWH83951.1 DUF4349 domain-containing protein [Algibacter marinivivus]